MAGGPEGVAPEALAPLPAPQRAAGTDRYGTAAELAVESVDRGWTPTTCSSRPA